MDKISCAAVIVAAGNSTRMKSLGNKQLLEIYGVPVLIRTINAFAAAKQINKIVIVAHRDSISEISYLIKKFNCKKVSAVIEGGNSRQESVARGLNVLSRKGFVAVHDGARPFITPEKIDEAVLYAKEKGNAVLGIPLSDTAKIVDEKEMITATPVRGSLRLVQTPQIFPVNLLKKAYKKASKDGFSGTDDSSLVERLNIKVHYLFGDYNNIKITTPEDIPHANAIYRGGNKINASRIRVRRPRPLRGQKIYRRRSRHSTFQRPNRPL